MSTSFSPLRLNVGFIIYQGIGYSRDFDFDLPTIRLEPDLDLSSLTGMVRVSRTPQGLLMQAKFQAQAKAECVRCLSEYSQILSPGFSDLYAFNKRSMTESYLLLPEDGKIDLEPMLREYMLLEMPISPLCKPDCRGLCQECGENLNFTTCNHAIIHSDSHLDVLRSFVEDE